MITTKDFLHYHMLFKKVFKEILKTDQTPVSEIELLMLLDEQGEQNIGDVSKKMDITRPNMTPLLDGLINKGLIGKAKNRKDKRETSVFITQKGKEENQKNMENIKKRLDEYLSSMSQNQIDMIKLSCDNITYALKKD